MKKRNKSSYRTVCMYLTFQRWLQPGERACMGSRINADVHVETVKAEDIPELVFSSREKIAKAFGVKVKQCGFRIRYAMSFGGVTALGEDAEAALADLPVWEAKFGRIREVMATVKDSRLSSFKDRGMKFCFD